MSARIEDNALFYVLVPVYKVEKYIKECIESVLSQTYQNFKMILVDDGSPDRSGEICEEYAKMDNRVKVIHQKNMGLIAARQAAIRFIQHLSARENTYVIFLDSDDSLKKTALARISEVIQKNGCDMVIYGMERVMNGKTVIPYNDKNGIERIVTDKRELYSIVFNDAQYNPMCRKAVSFDLIPVVDYSDYYHISHAEDLLQSIAYYKRCRKAYFLNESLYNYTINPSSITQSVSEKNFRIDFTIREMVHEFLLTENVFSEADWKQYHSYCVDIIASKIRVILTLPIENRKKKDFLIQISKSNYYSRYIHGKPYDTKTVGLKVILYKLFVHQVYWPLFLLGNLYEIKYKRKVISKDK